MLSAFSQLVNLVTVFWAVTLIYRKHSVNFLGDFLSKFFWPGFSVLRLILSFELRIVFRLLRCFSAVLKNHSRYFCHKLTRVFWSRQVAWVWRWFWDSGQIFLREKFEAPIHAPSGRRFRSFSSRPQQMLEINGCLVPIINRYGVCIRMVRLTGRVRLRATILEKPHDVDAWDVAMGSSLFTEYWIGYPTLNIVRT